MPHVKANPNEFLLTGRGGALQNRGSAVTTYLWPGTVFVLVPSGKQEATFEFTQETRDGIPLRFKGIVLYRITDPVAAARLFDFAGKHGIDEINAMLVHVSLGELRHAVSHMTMTECIEQRKTTLSEVVATALRATTQPAEGDPWGVSIEVAQVAQVYIVDADLRAKLEAEVRNQIKLKADKSEITTAEASRLTAMASEERVAEQRLAADRDALRRREALFAAEMAAEQARLAAETPVRLERIEREREVLAEELEMHRIRGQVRAAEVEHELLLPRAEQQMRREMLPLEQAPRIAEAASRVLHGTNLTVYGDDAKVLGQVAPVLEALMESARRAMATGDVPKDAPRETEPA